MNAASMSRRNVANSSIGAPTKTAKQPFSVLNEKITGAPRHAVFYQVSCEEREVASVEDHVVHDWLPWDEAMFANQARPIQADLSMYTQGQTTD